MTIDVKMESLHADYGLWIGFYFHIRMAKKKQGQSKSQCRRKMRRLKFHLQASGKFKNESPPASTGLSPNPTLSPGGVSAMRVTVSAADNPSPGWRKRKKRLRFSQFLEVRIDVNSYSVTLFYSLTSI